MNEKIKILAIGGSLRKGSLNRILLNATLNANLENIEVISFDRLGEIPVFNQEFETNLPEVVKEFKAQIKSADALLFVTPEYNYSIPGYLKNAIDWASRPYGDNSFNDKPAAIMSSSTGMLGGARAQYALRQVGVFLNIHFINQPEAMVPGIMDKITDEKLTDEHTLSKINEVLKALYDWTLRLR